MEQQVAGCGFGKGLVGGRARRHSCATARFKASPKLEVAETLVVRLLHVTLTFRPSRRRSFVNLPLCQHEKYQKGFSSRHLVPFASSTLCKAKLYPLDQISGPTAHLGAPFGH